MATESQAVESVGRALNQGYQDLVNIMDDIGRDGTYNYGPGCTLGGIHLTAGPADTPQFQLTLAMATGNEQIKEGQLTDGIMKLAGMKKATAQKIG